MKKRTLFLPFISLLWAFALMLQPLAVDFPSPSSDFYVNDFADVLNDETESHIMDINDQMQPKTGAQIVVVTVDFLDGLNSEEYAYRLFNDWGIGSSKENNGVLILLSPGEEKYWITVGAGLETTLSSGTLGRIVTDDIDACFDEQEYDRFVISIFDGIADILADEYDFSFLGDTVSSFPNYNDYQDYDSDYYEYDEPSVFFLICIFILILITVSVIKKVRRLIGSPPVYRRTYIPRPRIPNYRPPRPPVNRLPHNSSWGGGSSFGRGPSNFGGGASFGSSSRRSGGSSGFGGGSHRSSGSRSGGGGRSRGGGFGRR